MPENSEIVFQRKGNEPALIIHVGDNLNSPDLSSAKEILGQIGLEPEQILRWLRFNFTPVAGPSKFTIPNSDGDPVEDVETYIADSPIGQIEVARCKVYPAVVPKSGIVDTIMHQKNSSGLPGFEAFYITGGEGKIRFPSTVEPVGTGVYKSSEEYEEITLRKGDLAVIPAPTANNWSGVTAPSVNFIYLAHPPYIEKSVKRFSSGVAI